ncbi:translation elongation factor Ts [Pontibacter sp. G13]|uniref:translation elongation factor Ts n=1 Tax=Pontibacter sp. G13 TaxID=3074898 RepID=UPI00288A9625|nr:translation elongation factor Ts [Pontibacter sp. G13]WNJ16162.1 translation elongation factor Ts [Pontibacter sp. G13]
MAITAKDVNKLRQATGAGMMDCKKALVEAEGDFDKAVEILRLKGQKVSAKRADREAKEGAVFIQANEAGTEAALIELNCETDFVARNEDFQALGQSIAVLASQEKPATIDALKGLSLDGTSVAETLTDAMGKIGEKLDVSKFELITGEQVVTYIHPGARIGVAVAFSGVNGGDATAVGKDVAMQIAAMNPVGIDKDSVDQSIVDKEIEIGKQQAIEEGKPENIVEKIAMGKLNKFFKENTLLNQDFVKDTSRSVKKYVSDELGKEATIVAFKRLQLGAN